MLGVFVIVVALSVSAFSYKENPTQKCTGPHEYYTETKRSCPPELCVQIVAFIDCRESPPDSPGCACEPGYLRLNETSPCIRTCQCPQMKNAPECHKYH